MDNPRTAALIQMLVRDAAAVQACLTDPEASLTLHTQFTEVQVQLARAPSADKQLTDGR